MLSTLSRKNERQERTSRKSSAPAVFLEKRQNKMFIQIEKPQTLDKLAEWQKDGIEGQFQGRKRKIERGLKEG